MSTPGFPSLTDLVNKHRIKYFFYHAGCGDGWLSKLLVQRKIKELDLKTEVEFVGIPAGGKIPPTVVLDEKTTSGSLDVIPDQEGFRGNLYAIDHHKTNVKLLEKHPDDMKKFDMNHSACGLVWEWLYPNVEPPLLVKYVEDRDLWAKRYPDAEHFITWLYLQPMTDEEYEKYFDNKIVEAAVEKGRVLAVMKEDQIQQAIKHANFKICNGLLYAVVNSTVWKSDIGNRMLDYPVDFSIVYSTDSNYSSMSLRSEFARADVSKIAEGFGGGGHRNASGVRLGLMTELPGSTSGYVMYTMLNNIIQSPDNTGTLNHNWVCGPKPDEIATFAKRILGIKRLTVWHETPDGKKSQTV